MAKKNQSVGSDRQAKIQAAAKASAGGGANKIIVAAVVAIVAIVAVVGWVVFSQISAQNAIKGDGNAVPTGATMGGPYNAFADVTPKAGAPTVDLFEDFQCPGCGGFESVNGSTVEELATSGEIVLNYHVLNFLDSRLGNDGSTKAANAAFCAAEVGKFQQMHDLLYKNQPKEGDGWTTDALTKLGGQIGLSGDTLTTFTKCIDLGKYTNYVKATNDKAFGSEGIKGTPSIKINGKMIDTKTIATPEAFKAAVAAAATK